MEIPPLLTRLGCPLETYQLFDFYHVMENLKVFADVAFHEEAQSKEWFKKARKTLKKGNAKSLISQMDELIAVATGERCKIMVGKRNYLLDAYREGRLNYDKAITQKLPIGSGAIESLIRQVANFATGILPGGAKLPGRIILPRRFRKICVNLRIKGNSKFWLKENAEIMLHLRCQWMAGSWDNFCDSIFNSFIKPQTA
jgi:hypothetical protein